MFCFSSSKSKYQKLALSEIVSIKIPTITREGLPILPEHKIQNLQEEIIDDPSIIFYDPDEKPGFMYHAVPFVSKGLDFTYEDSFYEHEEETKDKHVEFDSINNKIDREIRSNSPQYDDSLDGNSRPVTPLPIRRASFDGDFDMGLRQDSLELENIDDDGFNYPVENFLPTMESTRNIENNNKYNQNSFNENSYIDDFGGLNLYGDNLLSEVRLNLNSNKGYTSDAESVKTYQDSGIYDDDLVDSPKSLASVARQLVFGDDYGTEEKYSSYKTPLSSRQSSVESLNLESTVLSRAKPSEPVEFKREDLYLGNFRISDRPKRMIYRFLSEENLECKTSSPVERPRTLHIFSSCPVKEQNTKSKALEANRIRKNKKEVPSSFKEKDLISPGKSTIKTSNKYSHVQAKVQCHRTKGERSPSPGASLRNKSPGPSRGRSASPGNSLKNKTNKRTKSPGGTYAQDTISSAIKAKQKSKSVSKTPPDRSKIFNEKLTFREKAKSRTDSHGVEMYSNLPKEFQEIARRLARQDRELKKSEADLSRGRSLSRKSSRLTSRASSMSPNRERVKSTSEDAQNMEIFTFEKENETPSKVLSRSSSIRSIPSTPALSRQHPLPELQARAKSPGASPGRSPAHRLSHENATHNKNKQLHLKNSTTSNKKVSTPSPVSKLYTFTTVNDSFATSPIG